MISRHTQQDYFARHIITPRVINLISESGEARKKHRAIDWQNEAVISMASTLIKLALIAEISEISALAEILDRFFSTVKTTADVKKLNTIEESLLIPILQRLYIAPRFIDLHLIATVTNSLDHLDQRELDLLPDLIETGNLLSSKSLTDPILDQLEQELWDYARKKLTTEEMESFIKDPASGRKILSGFLYEWAQQHGFSGSAKLLKNIRHPSLFLALLTEKRIIKDDLDSSQHGAWPHALQQYIIFEHHKQTDFLQRDPMQVYSTLGSLEHGEKLWDMFFDEALSKLYCSPERFLYEFHKNDSKARWPAITRIWDKYANKADNRRWAGKNMKFERKHPSEYAGIGIVRRPFFSVNLRPNMANKNKQESISKRLKA